MKSHFKLIYWRRRFTKPITEKQSDWNSAQSNSKTRQPYCGASLLWHKSNLARWVFFSEKAVLAPLTMSWSLGGINQWHNWSKIKMSVFLYIIHLNLETNYIFKFAQLHWLQLMSCLWRTVSFIVWKVLGTFLGGHLHQSKGSLSCFCSTRAVTFVWSLLIHSQKLAPILASQASSSYVASQAAKNICQQVFGVFLANLKKSKKNNQPKQTLESPTQISSCRRPQYSEVLRAAFVYNLHTG